MAKRFPEFPTDWHQERYVEDLERELAGARARGDKDYEQNVLKELSRFGKGKLAAKAK